jgi:hypothetical protein
MAKEQIAGQDEAEDVSPRALPVLDGSPEVYDAWKGELCACTDETDESMAGESTTPLKFTLENLTLDNPDISDTPLDSSGSPNGNRLSQMLAAQAAHRDEAQDESLIATSDLSLDERKSALQKALIMAASNGDLERIETILQSRALVDLDAADDEGSTPLIYASCFVRASPGGRLSSSDMPGSRCSGKGVAGSRSQR